MESFELPLQYKDIYVLVFNVLFQIPAKTPRRVLALINHMKIVDMFYELAAGLPYVLELIPQRDPHLVVFANLVVQREMGGC